MNRKLKNEIKKGGYTVVLEDGGDLTMSKLFILGAIEMYCMLVNRELKIVFFNFEGGSDKGVSFFFRKND